MKNLFFSAIVLLLFSCSSENTNFTNEKEVNTNPIDTRALCLFEGTIEEPADWFEDFFYFDDDCNLVTDFPNENVYWSVNLYNSTGTSSFGSTGGYQYGNGFYDVGSIGWNGAIAYVCLSSSIIPGSQTSTICCGWMTIPDCCCGFMEPHDEEHQVASHSNDM